MSRSAQLAGFAVGIECTGDGECIGIRLDHGVEQGIKVRNSMEVPCC
jgi:hypothetical protein